MGREIRRVPANWEHPKYTQDNAPYPNRIGDYRPMFDECYLSAVEEWFKEHQLWEKGEHPDQKGDDMGEYRYYADWNGNPPDRDYYHPDWKPEEMTWWQVYETVSEGTPVSPAFATPEELIEYLIANGDFWDQRRRRDGSSMECGPWSRKSAETFVKGSGWAPSFISTPETGLISGVQALGELHTE